MKHPAVGRIVHVFADPKFNNGSDIAPAVITRVWNERGVNVRVLLDGPDTPWVTSIPLYQAREEAQEGHEQHRAEWEAASSEPYPIAVPFAAFWPPHVGEQVVTMTHPAPTQGSVSHEAARSMRIGTEVFTDPAED